MEGFRVNDKIRKTLAQSKRRIDEAYLDALGDQIRGLLILDDP